MSIFNLFENLELSNDQHSAVAMLETFLDSSNQVFMLKGYAGSGKTTILKGLINYLNSRQLNFLLMAPTGRAAKILRDKTGFGKTIHSGIYDFEKLTTINANSDEDADQSFHYYFPIRQSEAYNEIIIIDEASMISSRQSKSELFTFGTDILLDDLLTYSRLSQSNNKIILVGDPAQLPPVNDNKSEALNEDFFRALELNCQAFEMKQVLRQENNLILTNATSIRNLLELNKRNTLQFNYDETSFLKINPELIASKYLDFYPIPQIGIGVIITFSNAQCLAYNRAIRERLFPGSPNITAGDILSINNNNYHTYGAEIFNGDMAQVVSVSNTIESQSAPVWIDVAGKRVKKIVTFQFRDIKIRIPNFPEEIHCKIIDSLLNSENRDLGLADLKGLYINFVMRFKEEQKQRKEKGLDYFYIGSEQFKQSLKSDPYINAMRVKYGYAVTCHKAQGGEWDTVFVDYYGRVGLSDAHLRWCYTATTRGINRCYVSNAPHFGVYSKLNFSKVVTTGTFSESSLNLKNVPVSPYHTTDQHRCKSLKYWELVQKLDSTSYSISRVESFGPYLERYYLIKDNEEYIIDGNHNKAGFFSGFKSKGERLLDKEILESINSPHKHVFSIEYNPTNIILDELFSKIQLFCDELEITLSNIEEKPDHYYIIYYFITSGISSNIQFYYNGNFQFTTAIPKSDKGNNDDKLIQLITKLSNDAN